MNSRDSGQRRDEVLAASLTAEDVGLLPHLPYLLQDLWMLGGDPGEVVAILRGRLPEEAPRILDLACGKGAVSIALAKAFGARVLGVDLLPAFVEEARQKAKEHGVEQLCTFEVGDANEAAQREGGWDCVVFSAAGNVLGEPDEMLTKLAGTLRPRGLAVVDESYLPEGTHDEVRYQHYELLTARQWDEAFERAGFSVVESALYGKEDMADGNEHDMAAIEMRAAELSEKYPEKRELFAAYVRSQHNEVHDLENTLDNALWLLEKQPLCGSTPGGL